MANIDILSMTVALSLDGTEYVPIVQGGTNKRVTTQLISNLAQGFVPITREVNGGTGISGGGALSSDLTLNFAPTKLNTLTTQLATDKYVIQEVSDGSPRTISFANSLKAINTLSASPALNLTADKFVVYRAADGLTYSATASQISLAAGNVPAGGLTGQSLVKASDADYDTEWSTGGFLDQPPGYFFGGPTSGPDAPPDFRGLVGTDLPNPGASSKGGVQSYAAVSNQFLTQIGTDGSVSSAQPSFSNISGTAGVAQGGTGLTSGTSGGILGFTGATTLASSVALTANALVLGGGAGATPAPLGSLGTTTTVLHGNAAGAPTWGAVSLTTDVSGILPVANGGTGNSSLGALTRTDDTNVTLTLGGSPSTALVNAASLTLGWTGQLAVSRGGTGLSSVTQGDLLYASASNTLSALAKNTSASRYLSNTGTSNNPAWAQIDLSNGVTGQLPLANGGTNANLTASNGGIFYSTASAGAILSGTATANQVLLSGSSAAPAWSTATYPATTTINQLLYSSSANTIVGLATANGGMLNASSSGVPSMTVTPTLGVQQTTRGQLILANTAAGAFPATLQSSNSATAATTFTFPADAGTNGYVLSTNGSGVTSWIAVGGTGTVTSVAASFTGGLLSVGGSPITAAGTLAFTVAGTSGGIPYFSSASTWASSAALAANAIVLGGGAGAAPATTTTGTGVVTALGVNVGSSGAFVVNAGALGTPSAGTLTNCTGLPASGVTGTALVLTGNSTITGGFRNTGYSGGTVSSGTYTPDAYNSNYQYYTNNGAHTLAAPANDCAVDILVTNGGSAGSITFSGFTVGSNTGSSLTTTNTSKFLISIRRINSIATYSIYALQ